MGTVENLQVVTPLNWDPDRIIAEAQERGLKEIVIIGTGEDGEEYFTSSVASGPDVLWMLERAKLKLLRKAD